MEIEDFQLWLKQQIAEEGGIDINEISCNEEFSSFKLDSLSLITISFELERILNKEIDPTVFTEFSTINKLAEWLKTQN